MDGATFGPGRTELFEIDDTGSLTPEEKAEFPAYFRIVRKDTRQPPAMGPEPAVEDGTDLGGRLDELRRRDPDALRFVDYVNTITDDMNGFAVDGNDRVTTLLLQERKSMMDKLRPLAAMFLKGADSAGLLREAHETFGFFEGAANVVRMPAEVVRIETDRSSGLARDLNFQTAVSNRITEAQQRLIIDVGRALTVVSVVLSRRESEARSVLGRLLARLRGQAGSGPAAGPESPQRKRDSYVRRLAHIARSGLREPDASYGRQALETFKLDFVDMEADTVKNQYVRLLGQRALLFSLLFGSAWAACLTIFAGDSFAASAAPFLLTAVGACGGTWLSFAIRRVVLEFKDLALLEDDRLHPMSRILFVVGLTWLVGMFLQSGVVNAEVNGIEMRLDSSEIVGLLIGAMCGIAERALAGAIGKRSEDFATRFGAPVPPVAAPVNGPARAL